MNYPLSFSQTETTLTIHSPHGAITLSRTCNWVYYSRNEQIITINRNLNDLDGILEDGSQVLYELSGSNIPYTTIHEKLADLLPPIYDNWLPEAAHVIQAVETALTVYDNHRTIWMKSFENHPQLIQDILTNPAAAYVYSRLWNRMTNTDMETRWLDFYGISNRPTIETIRHTLSATLFEHLRDMQLQNQPVSDPDELSLYIQLSLAWQTNEKEVVNHQHHPYLELRKAIRFIEQQFNRSGYNSPEKLYRVLARLLRRVQSTNELPLSQQIIEQLDTEQFTSEMNRWWADSRIYHQALFKTLKDFEKPYLTPLTSFDSLLAIAHTHHIPVHQNLNMKSLYVFHTCYKDEHALSFISQSYQQTKVKIQTHGPFGLANYATRYAQRTLNKLATQMDI